MRKLMIAVLVLGIVASASASFPNLITDSGFEDPNYWLVSGAGGFSTSVYQEGAQSGYLSGPQFGRIFNDFYGDKTSDLDPETDYVFITYLTELAGTSDAAGAGFWIRWYDEFDTKIGSDVITPYAYDAPQDGSWLHFAQTVTSPADADYALVAVCAYAGGGTVNTYTIYYDDFQMRVPEPTTIALLGLGALALVRRKR